MVGRGQLQVDAHPSAAVESAWQTMMAGTESLLTNWGWGYILHLTKLPALLHGISSRLILQDTCIAFGYLVHVDQNKCIKMSEIVSLPLSAPCALRCQQLRAKLAPEMQVSELGLGGR